MTAAEQLVQRAEALIDLGRPAQATQIAHKALADRPDDAGMWLTLARAELAQDHAREALDAARRAGALDADEAASHWLASHALSELGWHREAIAAAQESVRLAPHTWVAHSRLAEALAAPRHWETALPLPFVLVSRILPRRRAARRIGRYALSLAPDEPDVHFALGNVIGMGGQHREARRIYRQVLGMDPQHGGAMHNLATLDMARGRVGAALTGFSAGLSTTSSAESNERLTWLHNMVRISQWVGVIGGWVSAGVLVGSALWLWTHPDGIELSLAWLWLVLSAVLLPAFVGQFLWNQRGIPRHLRPLMRGLPRFGPAGLERRRIALIIGVGAAVAALVAWVILAPHGSNDTGLYAAIGGWALLAGIVIARSVRTWLDRRRYVRSAGPARQS